MGKYLTVIVAICMFCMFGCVQKQQEVIEEGPQDHEHIRSNLKVIGEYHAQLAVNHYNGTLYLFIYDIAEREKKINAEQVEAVVTLPDGTKRPVTLKPDISAYKMRKYHQGRQLLGLTNGYALTQEWLKQVHDFTITFQVPIETKTYQVSFAYHIDDMEHSHHPHD